MEVRFVISTVSSLFTEREFVHSVGNAKKTEQFSVSCSYFLRFISANHVTAILAPQPPPPPFSNHIYGYDGSQKVQPKHFNDSAVTKESLFTDVLQEFNLLIVLTALKRCFRTYIMILLCDMSLSAAGWEADDVVLRWRLLNIWTWMRSTSQTIQR